jgi:hypothetical protein
MNDHVKPSWDYSSFGGSEYYDQYETFYKETYGWIMFRNGGLMYVRSEPAPEDRRLYPKTGMSLVATGDSGVVVHEAVKNAHGEFVRGEILKKAHITRGGQQYLVCNTRRCNLAVRLSHAAVFGNHETVGATHERRFADVPAYMRNASFYMHGHDAPMHGRPLAVSAPNAERRKLQREWIEQARACAGAMAALENPDSEMRRILSYNPYAGKLGLDDTLPTWQSMDPVGFVSEGIARVAEHLAVGRGSYAPQVVKSNGNSIRLAHVLAAFTKDFVYPDATNDALLSYVIVDSPATAGGQA